MRAGGHSPGAATLPTGRVPAPQVPMRPPVPRVPAPQVPSWPTFHHVLQHTGRSRATGPSSATLKWQFPLIITPASPVIASDGTIYIGSEDHDVYTVAPNGTMRWQYTAGAAIDTSPAIGTDGTIAFGSNDNSLYTLH